MIFYLCGQTFFVFDRRRVDRQENEEKSKKEKKSPLEWI